MAKKNNKSNNDKDINNYQKKSFIKRLPFGVKASFIKYWFYGALYFFCFMGLGLFLKNETLIIVTGLIGGILFDLATYNIFLLIADSREEASKWWFFKSKKFYSIFINAIVIIGLLFLFYFIVIPIRKYSGISWLFGEPLTSALLLLVLDTSLVWIKNLIVMFFFHILKKDPKKNKKEDYIKIIDISPISITFEVNNQDIYKDKPFNVLLNNEVILKKVTNNVITIFDLKPDVSYKLAVNYFTINFVTTKISRFYKVYEGNDIQEVIDNAEQYSLIVVNKGNYDIKSLTFKNNIYIYFRKGVILKASAKKDDYPLIPPFKVNNKDEVYGNFNGTPSLMRQSIFFLDHVSGVKIIGEGELIGPNKNNFLHDKASLMDLIFINHSFKISLIGLTLKNAPNNIIHPFFSSEINLIDLKVTGEENNAIRIDCSSYINIIGGSYFNLRNGICFSSGKLEFKNLYSRSTKNIIVRNILMENIKTNINIGSNIISSIYELNFHKILMKNSLFGIYIKSNTKMDKNAYIKDINFNKIEMENVLTPLIINMSHNNMKNESKINSAYFGSFSFNELTIKDYLTTAGLFLGLENKYIDEISITNSNFVTKEGAKEELLLNLFKCQRSGFIVQNVKTFRLNNVKLNNINDKRIQEKNVSEIIDK